MVIVDSQSDYDNIRQKLVSSELLIFPIFINEFMHPALKSISLLWVHIIDLKEDYILTFDHSELIFDSSSFIIKDISYNNKKRKYIFNYKDINNRFNITNAIDLEVIQYLDSGTKLLLPENKLFGVFKDLYPKYKRINNLIPLVKWIEYFDIIKPILLNLIFMVSKEDRACDYYSNIILYGLSEIEKNGLCVKTERLMKSIDTSINVDLDSELIYSQYNIFTTTGRPSNRFNTINFAALSKDSGVRNIFKSRFEKGAMLEFDFESYHLRILGFLVNYKFPDKIAVHEYLGRKYFNKDILTESEYDESKQISFRQLYGGIQPEYVHIEFLKRVNDYAVELWDIWNRNGYIVSPISGRRLYKKNFPRLSAQKLLNYFIQCLETEINLKKICLINDFLKQYETKMILYTYDSVLFDFSFNDSKKCFSGIREILEGGGFVTKAKAGPDYGSLEIINK
jgi:hypothetical protein